MNIISKIYDKFNSCGIYTSRNHTKNESLKTSDNLLSTIDSKTSELTQNKDKSLYNLLKTNINQIVNEIITEDPNKEPTSNYLTKESILSLKVSSLGIDYLNAFSIPFSISNIFLSTPISIAIGLTFLLLKYFSSINDKYKIIDKSNYKPIDKISKIKEKIKDFIKWSKIDYIFDKIGKIKSYIPLYPALKVPSYLKINYL
jgi:hypothetical protein